MLFRSHAVSDDLILWKEKDDALMPWRRDWFIASGSAMVDKKGVAGHGKNAVVAAFTCLGAKLEDKTIAPSGGQFIAISENAGNSFRRISDMPAIPVPNGADWRDPRLFEDDGVFYIAVYERREDVNGVAFYASSDMKKWEAKSWIPDLFECPDLFKLPVIGTENSKWILYGADGLARLGDFNKGIFTCDGTSFPLDYGHSTYAGQTWSHEPKDRRVHISWIRGMDGQTDWEEDMGYQEMPFSQCMSIPCEFDLHYTKGQYHLCRYPVKELDTLRIEPVKENSYSIDGEKRIPLHSPSDVIFRIDSRDKLFEIKIGPCSLLMNFLENTVEIDEKGIRKLRCEETQLRILTDRTCVEIFVNQEVSATYSLDTKDLNICFSGKADICQQEWDLWSVWRKSNSK